MSKAKRVGVRQAKSMISTVLDVIKQASPKERRKIASTLVLAIEAVADTPTRRATAKFSKAWKDLERQVAKTLRGKRISRGDDFSRSDVDVICEFRALKIDAKFRAKHGHHTFMNEIERKYCTKPGDVPVLVTKTPGQQGAYVTVPLDHYALLLDVARTRVFSGVADEEILLENEIMRRVRSLRFKYFKQRKVRSRPPSDMQANTLARMKPKSRGMLHEILTKGRGTARMTRRAL